MNTQRLVEEIIALKDKAVDPTIINTAQLSGLVKNLLEVAACGVEGDVVELGCYVGESSKRLRRALNTIYSDKQLYVYDSFEGLPPLAECEKDCGWRPGTLKTTREILIRNFIDNNLAPPIITKGWFKDIPSNRLPEKISFAFLDGDFYDSIYSSLEKVYDRVADGGIILFHDYGRPDLPGVEKAVKDFFEARKIDLQPEMVCDQLWRVVKGKANLNEVITWDLSNLKNNYDLPLLLKPKVKPTVTNKELTIVSGLWNIRRPGRDFNHYLENFDRFLKISNYMVLHVPKELESFVWERRSPENTYVRVYELSDIKNLYSPFWDKTQKIRTDPKWYNQTGEHGWLTKSPQAESEWYNPIVQSKMFMLHDAKVLNPFNTDYLVWLDAGITNTVGENYFVDMKCMDFIVPHLKTFLFLSYPYETTSEIHGFEKKAIDSFARKNVKYVCRGGLFGGHKDFITQANVTYYGLLMKTLDHGYMGTEESLYSIMAHTEPHIYKRYELDANGLIVKFAQALIDGNVELASSNVKFLPKRIYNEKTDKTTLYMLTFNFPQQIEHTISTWIKSSRDWLEKPRKVLIDNSNKPEAIAANKIIADHYGFEHIVTGKNGGICGGRQLAAEHFDASDSDYYFFFEDDMGFYPDDDIGYCRNGFRKFIPNLYKNVHEIMAKEDFDFLKLSYTEVYMDNNIQVSWYNVPQAIRSANWPDYDMLPIGGLDPYAPRTKFDKIEVHNGVSYAFGEIYYANWPMIMSKKGNKKVFIDTKWAHPYEQTWMSHVYQKTLEKEITPGILLASPVQHDRIAHYKPEDRREN